MNIRKIRTAVVAMAVMLGGLGLATETRAKVFDPSARSAAVMKYWTKERMKRAKPRDFIFNPATRKFRPAPSKKFRKGTSDVLAASWTDGGEILKSSGKVFFTLGGYQWQCTGSVVDDEAADRSIVVTAAHCAYDEKSNQWATNWMFVPEYDSQPGSTCASTFHGCWVAQSLVVPNLYAAQPSFNVTATKHDYAFAVVGLGGKSPQRHLDAVVGSQPVNHTPYDTMGGPDFESDTWLFGYPAQGRYKGADLMYCHGLLDVDVVTDYSTYRLGCRLTAGSSGGPWFSPFAGPGTEPAANVGSGTVISVTSYGYSGIKALYGPQFGSESSAMHALAAVTPAGNVLYSQP